MDLKETKTKKGCIIRKTKLGVFAIRGE